MRLRRLATLVVALLAVLSLVSGTVGFSTIDSTRGVDIAVVDDEQAYVGVTVCRFSGNSSNGNASATNDSLADSVVDETVSNGSIVDESTASNTTNGDVVVHVSNRYTKPLTVTVDRELSTSEMTVGVGAAEQLAVDAPGTLSTLTVSAAASGFEATLVRPIHSETECPFTSTETDA